LLFLTSQFFKLIKFNLLKKLNEINYLKTTDKTFIGFKSTVISKFKKENN